ncbi:hypothetical protein CHS0354_029763 [Potamilus streckersoni]|uniref:Uncharacterized protein n=1 Tax=Potamilus streckersoni TaxID=2493646 RepID=A0AAE0TH42_9BIVA|nr:hypothetical protein CHS0354_029763 [Potamilus streckersoni]
MEKTWLIRITWQEVTPFARTIDRVFKTIDCTLSLATYKESPRTTTMFPLHSTHQGLRMEQEEKDQTSCEK